MELVGLVEALIKELRSTDDAAADAMLVERNEQSLRRRCTHHPSQRGITPRIENASSSNQEDQPCVDGLLGDWSRWAIVKKAGSKRWLSFRIKVLAFLFPFNYHRCLSLTASNWILLSAGSEQ